MEPNTHMFSNDNVDALNAPVGSVGIPNGSQAGWIGTSSRAQIESRRHAKHMQAIAELQKEYGTHQNMMAQVGECPEPMDITAAEMKI